MTFVDGQHNLHNQSNNHNYALKVSKRKIAKILSILKQKASKSLKDKSA